MNITAKFRCFLTLLSLFAGPVHAAVISDFTDYLTPTGATQTGRLSRNAVPQDWSGDEAFPGVINTSSVYHYQAYVVNVGITPYIQIDVDSLAPTTFVSVYGSGYAPDPAGSPDLGFDTNWLGDAGGSGNYFGTDPRYFQVIASVNQDIVIVVNQSSVGTSAAAGIGATNPFHITVEGWIDADFDDPVVPEPSSVILAGSGFAFLLLAGNSGRLRRLEAARSC